MKTDLTTLTVAQYCQHLTHREYLIDRTYQRTNRVWTRPAKSALIETILLDYPIPKLALHQVTDVKQRKTVHYIVDGQQRTNAILDYYNDAFSLSRTVKVDGARGKRFSQLDEELQSQFLNYMVHFDLFVGIPEDQIRQVFRRINSFTVPLNDEEQRHAEFQGEFKWFIASESQDYTQVLIDSGVLTERAVARMAEAKLFSEVCHAWTHGIQTTSKRQLDNLYREFDFEFPHEDTYSSRFARFFDWFRESDYLWKTPICKPFAFYTLLLAYTHVFEGIEALQPIFHVRNPGRFGDSAEVLLTKLADIMDLPATPEDPVEAAFWRACDSQTNVKTTREIRFRTFAASLERAHG